MKNVFSRLKILAFIMVIIFASCSRDEGFDENTQSEELQQSNLEEKYFLGKKVKVRKEEDGSYSLGGSDVRLFEEQLSDKPVAISKNPIPGADNQKLVLGGSVRKWPNNTVVYQIQGLSNNVRNELQKSFDEWTSKTSIRFKQRTNESNYVTISSNGQNCNCGVATLGMNGSNGFIRLGSGSTALVIIHEIGHTLGYLHEQNRPDRDQYIIINYQNIINGAANQFGVDQNAQLLTGTFDINSTMMYGSYTFSKNGLPTITDRQGNILPARRAALSNLDIQGTNQAYPGDGGGGPIDPDPSGPCDGVSEWNPNTNYFVGDRVTYQGNLYERDFFNWIFISSCN
ncbi:M12 family metallopeptidase [uncultured Aquimarina sp.]|uniref:M12 family metallopeptidase n=1 Tax=uncultured Aquimarina sp. TaxID=575652 RepID=UPI00262390BE|nr:M12 family metallopeptidase [uncultured Aquimarina sp.]